MPCEKINGFIVCYRNQYKIEHNGKWFYFEVHPYLGPIPLKCMGHDWYETRLNTPSGFYDAFEKFENLSETEQKKCLI